MNNLKRSFSTNNTSNETFCINRKGEKVKCQVLERRMGKNSAVMYYIHYDGTDKRMDEWVVSERLESINEFSIMKKRPLGPGNPSRPVEQPSQHGPKVRNIDKVFFGEDVMEAWYFSPIPKTYVSEINETKFVYFCDYCLRFFPFKQELELHQSVCMMYHPPGNEIYRSVENDIIVSVFEVDGEVETEYCQNLCYLAKLFLDHKTLQYDTVPFLFYILCKVTSLGCRFVGYFSKEKFSELEYNLACIMTLPCYQKRGFGNFLISLSYELSRIENKKGTPERPLSDLGEASYKKFWYRGIVKALNDLKEGDVITLSRISELTFFKVQDIIDTLIKYKSLVVNLDNSYKITVPIYNERITLDPNQRRISLCDPEKIHWVRYNNVKNKKNY